MITNQELNELHSGLDEISEFLLSKMKQDNNGFFWETNSHDQNTGIFSLTFNPSLWNGTGGIAWFFLALYEYSGKKNDLKTAEGAFTKIYHYCTHNHRLNPSLYDGISGVIYLGLELFRVTGNEEYLQQVSGMYDFYRQKILAEQTEDMLIGISGIIIAICTLYHCTQDQKLYDDIVILATTLLEKAQVAESGIKWGNNLLSIDALCGFSHGNSGIAFALLQLGKYFNNDEFIWLVKQAFRYENLYYDSAQNNWMDLRWEESKNRLPDLFDWNKSTFLREDFDLNAWAHGACGIGSARLSAFKITDDPAYKKDCKKIFERCKTDILTRSKKNHILFSGYGGISDFLLQYQETFKNREASDLAKEIVMESLKKSRNHGHSEWGVQKSEDLGLMTGTAGIGLSVLQMIKGTTLNSILHPELPENKPGTQSILNNINVKKLLFDRYYPKTIQVLTTFITLQESVYRTGSIEEFGDNLLKIIKTLPSNNAAFALDIHQFETFTINIRKKHQGTLCFQTRLMILKKELIEFSENMDVNLRNHRFVRTPFIDLYESGWNWKDENHTHSEPDTHTHVFYSTDQEIFHLQLDPFSTLILQLLENPFNIEELTQHFQYPEGEKEMMEEKIDQQMMELLNNFFIRIAE